MVVDAVQKFATSECKVKRWTKQLSILREIINTTDLKEEAKWGVPCYTYCGKNIVILSAFNNYCSISFLKGSLLKDPEGLLIKPTKNFNAERSLGFTDIDEILKLKLVIINYINEAIGVEKAGIKVKSKPVSEYRIQIEFQTVMDNDPPLKAAFDALTPGRQKGYILYFSEPKQSKTILSRIEKCIPKIMDGIGVNDRYR